MKKFIVKKTDLFDGKNFYAEGSSIDADESDEEIINLVNSGNLEADPFAEAVAEEKAKAEERERLRIAAEEEERLKIEAEEKLKAEEEERLKIEAEEKLKAEEEERLRIEAEEKLKAEKVNQVQEASRKEENKSNRKGGNKNLN